MSPRWFPNCNSPVQKVDKELDRADNLGVHLPGKSQAVFPQFSFHSRIKHFANRNVSFLLPSNEVKEQVLQLASLPLESRGMYLQLFLSLT